MKKSTLLLALVTFSLFFAIIQAQKQETKEEQDKRINDEFQKWSSQRGKKYQAAEKVYRSQVFSTNFLRVQQHNKDPTKTYVQKLNDLADLTQKQFQQKYLNKKINQDQQKKTKIGNRLLQYGVPVVSKTIDYTTSRKITPVRNQGSCGSCWAFAAVGVLEFVSLKRNGAALDLSEQQLVDCTYITGYNGCNGGWPSDAMTQVYYNGITSETSYPYKTYYSGRCLSRGGTFRIYGGYFFVGCQNLVNVLNTSAIAVTLDASQWAYYYSGIVSLSSCRTSINHAVLLVGVYPTYWKIKNSWGTGWGQSGYIRLQLGNTCGICQYQAAYVF